MMQSRKNTNGVGLLLKPHDVERYFSSLDQPLSCTYDYFAVNSSSFDSVSIDQPAVVSRSMHQCAKRINSALFNETQAEVNKCDLIDSDFRMSPPIQLPSVSHSLQMQKDSSPTSSTLQRKTNDRLSPILPLQFNATSASDEHFRSLKALEENIRIQQACYVENKIASMASNVDRNYAQFGVMCPGQLTCSANGMALNSIEMLPDRRLFLDNMACHGANYIGPAQYLQSYKSEQSLCLSSSHHSLDARYACSNKPHQSFFSVSTETSLTPFGTIWGSVPAYSRPDFYDTNYPGHPSLTQSVPFPLTFDNTNGPVSCPVGQLPHAYFGAATVQDLPSHIDSFEGFSRTNRYNQMYSAICATSKDFPTWSSFNLTQPSGFCQDGFGMH